MEKQSLESLKEKWKALGNVPINDDGETLEPFEDYPVGTDINVIWKGFENANPEFRVYEMLYGLDEEPRRMRHGLT